MKNWSWITDSSILNQFYHTHNPTKVKWESSCICCCVNSNVCIICNLSCKREQDNWTLLWQQKKTNFVFVTYTIIQSITSNEMYSLHLTHPSAHTLEAVGSQRCGARGAVGGSVPCSRVSPQSWRSRDSNPQPRITSPTLYPLGHGCPRLQNI